MTKQYKAQSRLMRVIAKRMGYTCRKQRGADWWVFSAGRPVTGYRLKEASLSYALAFLIDDFAMSPTLH